MRSRGYLGFPRRRERLRRNYWVAVLRCWQPLPLEGFNYQLQYTKSVCNSIISDSLPYPFASFIPASEEEERINQLTYEIEKLNSEQKLWAAFSAKHVQRFIWAEVE